MHVELYIDIEFPSCSIIERDAFSCCNASSSSAPLAQGICGAGLYQAPYAAECDPNARAAVRVLHDVLLYLSLTISFIFLAELLALAAIERITFLRNPFYVADLVIIVVAIFLELYLKSISKDSQAALAGLLVLSRSWRFIRIGHGLYSVNKLGEGVQKLVSTKVPEPVLTIHELEELEDHITHLEEELTSLRASEASASARASSSMSRIGKPAASDQAVSSAI